MMRIVLITLVAFAYAPVAAAQQGRVLVETDWALIGEVEAGVESPLLLPVLLAGGNGVTCVFDYGDHAVKCFDIAGRMLWRFGRSGRGPREFSNPTDLKIDGLGRVWVLDPTNVRLTILNTDGSVNQSLRMPAGLTRIAPHADSTFVTLGSGVKAFMYRLDGAGKVLSIGEAPAILEKVPPLLLEATAVPLGDETLLAFLYSDLVIRVGEPSSPAGYRTVRTIRGPETIGFPEIMRWRTASGHIVTRIPPEAPYGARGAMIEGGQLYVLFGGASELRDRVVDVYDVEALRYSHSIRLPSTADGMVSLGGGRFALLRQEPWPTLRFYRLERR